MMRSREMNANLIVKFKNTNFDAVPVELQLPVSNQEIN
jgi:hypothetical protein